MKKTAPNGASEADAGLIRDYTLRCLVELGVASESERIDRNRSQALGRVCKGLARISPDRVGHGDGRTRTPTLAHRRRLSCEKDSHHRSDV